MRLPQIIINRSELMQQKGVSEIIATILMLMITIGLAGTAFIYIQGSLLSRAQKQITLLDTSCSASTGTIFVTIRNLDPRLSIATNELLVRVDSVPVASPWGSATEVQAQNTIVGSVDCVAESLGCDFGATRFVKVIGPSGVVERGAVCE